jgi:hypothetical protein
MIGPAAEFLPKLVPHPSGSMSTFCADVREFGVPASALRSIEPMCQHDAALTIHRR